MYDVLHLSPVALKLELLTLRAVEADRVQRLERATADGAMLFPTIDVLGA